MNFSFGIITKDTDSENLNSVINSIILQKIQNFEIIVVGPKNVLTDASSNIKYIFFDESSKPGWITKKKNLITKNAAFENIVFLHDYVALLPGWYEGYIRFGSDWNVCMNRVEDIKGRRFYDWVAWDHPVLEKYSPLNYYDNSLAKFSFVPGGYWVAKKSFMLNNLLNETLLWGESEDIEWSLRVREKNYKFNPYSVVRHVKKHRGYKRRHSIYGTFA